MAGPKAKAGAGGGGGAAQRLKTIVRRLPADLPEQVFWSSVAPWVTREKEDRPGHEGASKALWSQFCPGKLMRSGKDKDKVFARAYIAFSTPDALVKFHRAYDGWIFRDKQGNVTQAVVEFAPYQRIPTASAKPDPRRGTIDLDADFVSFQASSNAPEATLTAEEPNAKKPSPTSTPLLDHLRAQKAAETSTRKRTSPAPTSAPSNAAPSANQPKQSKLSVPRPAKSSKQGKSKEKGRGKDKSSAGKDNGVNQGQASANPGSISAGAFPPIGGLRLPPPSLSQSQSRPRHQHPPRVSGSQQPPQISLLTRPPSDSMSTASPQRTPPVPAAGTPSAPPRRRPPSQQAPGPEAQRQLQINSTASSTNTVQGSQRRGGGVARGMRPPPSPADPRSGVSVPPDPLPAVRGRGRGRGRGGGGGASSRGEGGLPS